MKEITITIEEYKTLLQAKIICDIINDHEMKTIENRMDDGWEPYNIDTEFIDALFNFTGKYKELKKIYEESKTETYEKITSEDI